MVFSKLYNIVINPIDTSLPVAGWVLQEAEAEVELRRACEKKGKKQDWTDITNACQPARESQNKACPLEESCPRLKWWGPLQPCLAGSVLRKTWPWLLSPWWVATATTSWEKCDPVSNADMDCETAALGHGRSVTLLTAGRSVTESFHDGGPEWCMYVPASVTRI